MSQSYLISIGGTGSKCTEAFIHLCAAGLGPDHTHINFVEADQANANFTRAKKRLECYRDLRDVFRGTRRGEHGIGQSDFLRTQIDDGGRWSPVPSDVINLEGLFQRELMGRESQLMFDGLFDKRDRTDSLEVGFQGRPAIGAATVVASALDGEFWATLLEAVKNAKVGSPVRIFLVASIFGGTGASGFPNLATLIRTKLADAGVQGNVEVGGALLLPYFALPDNTSREAGGLYEDPDALLVLAQGAVDYYHRFLQFSKHKIFDDLYLVGWNPLIKLKSDWSKGGKEQDNPPLMPELYAALAAARFFAHGGEGSESGRLLVTSRDGGREVRWSDLPAVKASSEEVKRSLGQLVRFADAYAHLYGPHLERKPRRAIRMQSWFRRLVRGVDLDEDVTVRPTLQALQEYTEEVLSYFGTIGEASSGTKSNHKVELFDAPALADLASVSTGGRASVPAGMSRLARDNFSSVVADTDAPSLATVFDELNGAMPGASERGLGRFVNALYWAARTTREG